CDLRFAATGVKFTTAHGKLNLPPEFGLSWLLPRIIGLTRANDLLLTSRIFLSEEAEAMGLINRALPPEELMPHVLDYVKNMIRNVSRHSLKSSKQQIYIDLHRDVSDSLDESQVLLEQMMQEEDYIKGVKALQEKRSPDFD
ncbi:MAG: enoyl-CoA hydratase-related protein, partial [Pseudomonadota bacterium]